MYIHIWSAYVYTHICMYTNICTYLHNLYIYHICISCMHEVARKRAAFNKSKPGSLELVELTDLWSRCGKARFMLLDMPSWLTQKSSNFWSVSSVKPSITFHNDSLATATQRAPMPTLQHLVRWNRFGSELPLIDNAHTNSHWQGYTFVIILRLC